MKHFRSYQLAVTLYRALQAKQLPMPFGDQLKRASSSICLNLCEGSGKRTPVDQRRFYYMALGSLREARAIFDLCNEQFNASERDLLDHVSGSAL